MIHLTHLPRAVIHQAWKPICLGNPHQSNRAFAWQPGNISKGRQLSMQVAVTKTIFSLIYRLELFCPFQNPKLHPLSLNSKCHGLPLNALSNLHLNISITANNCSDSKQLCLLNIEIAHFRTLPKSLKKPFFCTPVNSTKISPSQCFPWSQWAHDEEEGGVRDDDNVGDIYRAVLRPFLFFHFQYKHENNSHLARSSFKLKIS